MTTTDYSEWADTHMHCVVDGAFGIYVPQTFCKRFEPSKGLAEEWETCLQGPDAERYWEAWTSILDSWKGPNGKKIYQEQDVFLFDEEPPEGFWDSFWGSSTRPGSRQPQESDE